MLKFLQVEDFCSVVKMSAVGILVSSTSIYPVPARSPRISAEGTFIKVSALIAPASRLPGNDYCSHSGRLKKSHFRTNKPNE